MEKRNLKPDNRNHSLQSKAIKIKNTFNISGVRQSFAFLQKILKLEGLNVDPKDQVLRNHIKSVRVTLSRFNPLQALAPIVSHLSLKVILLFSIIVTKHERMIHELAYLADWKLLHCLTLSVSSRSSVMTKLSPNLVDS